MMVWQLFSQSITRLQNKNHHLLAFNPRMTEEVKPESSISFNPLMVIPPAPQIILIIRCLYCLHPKMHPEIKMIV